MSSAFLIVNNTHPLDVAAVLVLASLQSLAQLLVPVIALVLTLSGWRPKPSTDVSSSPASEPEPLPTLTVAQLRKMARNTLGSAATIGGRRIAQARKADLLLSLHLSPV